MTSTVGVLLDEIPAAYRDQVANELLSEGPAFWEERARRQVHATDYRLIYRNFYYPNRGQLPLPPESVWNVSTGSPVRTTIDGHDLVVSHFTFQSVLVTGDTQPGLAEPKLKKVGGVWNEPFILPVDPELLLDRTGNACMSEDGFPDNSVDPENALAFYDDTCVAGDDLYCHLTEPGTEDCVDAVVSKVGSVVTNVVYTRLAWSDAIANQYRVGVSTPGVAQVTALDEALEDNRVTYTYIPADSCAIAEGCVGGSGWRRLLRFTASMKNVGTDDLFIGDVSGPNSVVVANGMVENSACHDHYHFNHYGDFRYGTGLGGKRAFCIESTTRHLNNEFSPLKHPYSCDFQGTAAGWGDDYIAGLDCQWIDITNVPTATNQAIPLEFEFNPEGFICEGDPIYDSHGVLTFEPTSFVGENGQIENAIACNEAPDWDSDNLASLPVALPATGGFIAEECLRGQLGPNKNCGFVERSNNNVCTPGATVNLSCKTNNQPQILRLCESSKGLNTGTACVSGDALAKIVASPTATAVSFTCPVARDATETGGRYAMYTAPLADGWNSATVTCTPAP